MDNLESRQKDTVVVERPGLLGQVTVQPIDVQGNSKEHPLQFVYEWSKFFSLPSGRMESVYNLAVWGFVGNVVGCFASVSSWLLVPPIVILGIMGIVSYYTPELAPVIALRLAIVILFVVATMVVL